MIFQRFFNSDLAVNSYLIGDKGSKQCAVIDPTRDVAEIAAYIRQNGLKLSFILETHVHADIVSGARELKAAFDNKPLIYASSLGGKKWLPAYTDHPVRDKERIELGPLILEAWHTPGHTPEHVIWLCYDSQRSATVPWFIFTGDLLFVGSVGRPDLLGEEAFEKQALELHESLFKKILSLPDFVEIYPAHGAGSLCGKGLSSRPNSTIGYERQFNESLQPLPFPDWLAKLKLGMPAAPKAFSDLKELNLRGATPLSALSQPKKLNQVKDMFETLFIDTRSPEEFSQKHLKGSLNVPLLGSFVAWTQAVLTPEMPFGLILTDPDNAAPLQKRLALIGLDNFKSFALWQDLEKTDGPFESLPLISPEEVTDDTTVIDVRTPSEWASGHIPNALHIELTELTRSLDKIPKDTPLATICGGGFRASLAASYLKKAGFASVSNIRRGMQGWREARLPIKTGQL